MEILIMVLRNWIVIWKTVSLDLYVTIYTKKNSKWIRYLDVDGWEGRQKGEKERRDVRRVLTRSESGTNEGTKY